jgi:hypothetical protein
MAIAFCGRSLVPGCFGSAKDIPREFERVAELVPEEPGVFG